VFTSSTCYDTVYGPYLTYQIGPFKESPIYRFHQAERPPVRTADIYPSVKILLQPRARQQEIVK
jgi:hypothetical protein